MKFTIPYFSIIFILFAITSCSSTPLPDSNQDKIPDDFFGMVGISQTGGEYRLLNEMGVKWVLKTFYWSEIEKKRNSIDFSGYDELVDTAKSEGKKIIALLGYETPWLYYPNKEKKYISPDNIPFFLHYVEETVLHFKDRVDVWQIWNEPNFMFWKGSRKDFFELSKLTTLKIREIDPNAYIIGGVFWRTPRGFIKDMHKAGAMENIDGLAFHPYAVDPQGSMQIYDKLLDTLSKINYDGPVWITEMGYPTRGWYPTKVSLDEQPSYVIKTITGAAARGARVLVWYELSDNYNKEEVPAKSRWNSEDFFGLSYPDYQRKNGAWAYELCARFLPGSAYSSDFPLRENIPKSIVSFCFLNGESGNNTLILWNDKNRLQRVNIKLPATALLHDISTGNSRPLPPELEIGKQPLFITWQGTDLPSLFK